MRKNVSTIKQYDYANEEEYKKDIENMRKQGYIPTSETGLAKIFEAGFVDKEKTIFTAWFFKSNL